MEINGEAWVLLEMEDFWWLLQLWCFELLKGFCKQLNNSLYFEHFPLCFMLSAFHGLCQLTFRPLVRNILSKRDWEALGIAQDFGWGPWVFSAARRCGQKLLTGLRPCLQESRGTCGLAGSVSAATASFSLRVPEAGEHLPSGSQTLRPPPESTRVFSMSDWIVTLFPAGRPAGLVSWLYLL